MHKACCTLIVALLLTTLTSNSFAERSMGRWVKKVHKPIDICTMDKSKARLAILNGMYNNRGTKWLLEGEDSDAVFARFDYRGLHVLMKIVYSTSSIQILFDQASGGVECTDLEDGVCYDNTRAYYNYSQHLRASIEQEAKWFCPLTGGQ